MNIPTSLEPTTLPLTVRHFQTLVRGGAFEDQSGQIELIHGRIVRMNPQGPEHSDPIDEIQDWSYEHAGQLFRIRIEKPIEIAEQNSCPEPDIAWVRRDRYRNRHPQPSDVRLLIEVSSSSGEFDRTEKLELYAEAEIAEYWRVDIPTESVTVCRDPFGRTYRSIVTHQRDATISPECLSTAKLAIVRLFRSQG
jgi:Uma2 family endonuclease